MLSCFGNKISLILSLHTIFFSFSRNVRTSSNVFLPHDENAVIRRVAERVANLTRTQVPWAEDMQVRLSRTRTCKHTCTNYTYTRSHICTHLHTHSRMHAQCTRFKSHLHRGPLCGNMQVRLAHTHMQTFTQTYTYIRSHIRTPTRASANAHAHTHTSHTHVMRE